MSQVNTDSTALSQAPTGTTAPGGTCSSRKAKVLIVEADQVSLNVFNKICTQLGHEALLTESIAHAREELHRQVLVDLIILESQLGKEWGWQLLRDLRNDALYKNIPVVVYTAHTERDLLLQYIDLGVQAVRAKPIKGEVVAAELEKALKSDWRGRMVQPVEQTCERLKIRLADYLGMLHTAALELDRESRELKSLLGTRNTPKMFESLRHMQTQGNLIGMPAVETVTSAIQTAIQQGELPKAIRGVQSIGLLVQLLNRISAEHHGDTGPTLIARAPTEKAPELPQRAPSMPEAKEGAAAFGRKMANTPAWIMGKYFSRLRKVVVFTEADISKIIDDAASEEPFVGFLQASHTLEKVPGATPELAMEQLASLPNFANAFARMVEQLGVDSPSDDSRAVIDRLGAEKTLVLCAAARASLVGLVESPLSLSHLLIHSLSTGLIAHELGRFFRLANSHLLFSGGLLHDIGRWLLAVKEPGFYSMAIGLAQEQNTDLPMAERMTYGISHEEAGLRLLEKSAQRRLLLDIAGYHNNPLSDAIDRENRISVALIHLANDLAYAAATDDSGESERLTAKMSSKYHPAWTVLQREGVDLPLPPAELTQSLAPLASSCNWLALVLASWASSARKV